MTIEPIGIDHKFLHEVKKLGKRNSSTLGHMPLGAFDEYALKSGIIGAFKDARLCGYLMFREVYRNNRVNIAHLCVDSTYRNQGVAVKLLEFLIAKYSSSNFDTIELQCRDDYKHASQLWAKIGFVAVNDQRSKSKEEHSLIHWKYLLNKHLSIFSPANYPDSLVRALIDTNIVLKLRDKRYSESDNPMVLFSDSVISSTQYFVSDESYSETLRDDDAMRAKSTRSYIQTFQRVSALSNEINRLSNELKSIITGDKVNDESDRRNIATCILCDIPYLLTFDNPLIRKSDAIEKEFNVKIMHPTQFVIELDILQNKEAYNPMLLQGSMYHEVSKMDSSHLKDIINLFWRQKEGEDKNYFKSKIHNTINNALGNIKIVKKNGLTVGVIGKIIHQTTMEVSVLRIKNTKQSKYLFMHLASDLISNGIREGIQCIKIIDSNIPLEWQEILLTLGFISTDGIFIKLIYDKVISYHQLESLIEDITYFDTNAIEGLSLYNIEKVLFPLKISDADIPSYIIPIKPVWAQSLFDNIEASMSLFGVDTQKLWNIENVYYRRVRPDIEEPHSRILWYVSDDSHSNRRKGIVASSYLDEVHIEEAKRLFDKYKHYGVYEWKDLMELIHQKPSNLTKALIFSHTEVFKRVIPLGEIQNILRNKCTFQSPLKISSAVYLKIYERRNNGF